MGVHLEKVFQGRQKIPRLNYFFRIPEGIMRLLLNQNIFDKGSRNYKGTYLYFPLSQYGFMLVDLEIEIISSKGCRREMLQLN